MKHFRAFTALAALTAVTQAHAGIFGLANDYNLFVINDATLSNSDVEGKVAIGGNATISNYSIALNSQGGTSLVVGKYLTFGNGSVYGDVVYGTGASISNVGPLGSQSMGSPIDFNVAKNELQSLSNYIDGLASNGTVNPNYSTLQLIGTDNDLNVFTIVENQINSFTSVDILAPTNSTILINVLGSNVNLPNIGYNFNGSQTASLFHKVLWNLPDATSLSANSLNGSLLAPFSNATLGYGAINGQVFTYNLTSTDQTNLHLFNGNIPNSDPVPEPATLAALTVGVGALIRRRRKSA